MPGDGIANDVMEAATIVLDPMEFDAEYVHADIGWKFWKQAGNPLPDRSLEILGGVDVALFGAMGKTTAEGKIRTYDMGGINSSLEVTEEVARNLTSLAV
ncbi:MAG: isocitrate/isopropylmalate dehydrogenase [Planctomycetota bacterium]|jgi:isocitrate/isopropylmalate dehydrogenase